MNPTSPDSEKRTIKNESHVQGLDNVIIALTSISVVGLSACLMRLGLIGYQVHLDRKLARSIRGPLKEIDRLREARESEIRRLLQREPGAPLPQLKFANTNDQIEGKKNNDLAKKENLKGKDFEESSSVNNEESINGKSVVKESFPVKCGASWLDKEPPPVRLVKRLQGLSISQLRKFVIAAVNRNRADALGFISRQMSEAQRQMILPTDSPPQTNWHRYGILQWTALFGDPRHQTFVESHVCSKLRMFYPKQIVQDIPTGHTALKPLGSENGPVAFGREKELQKLIHRLQNKDGKNPVLLGESGVGKTAIVEELARRMRIGDVPKGLKGMQIWALSLEELQGKGAVYSGLLEKELNLALEAIRKAGNIIVFVDEVHKMSHMGATGNNPTGTLAQSLKTELARSAIRFIGASTYDEFDKFVTRVDPAFARRWDKMPISEIPARSMKPLLVQIFTDYCIKGNKDLIISNPAIQRTIELAQKYLHASHSPDREINIIKESIEYIQRKQGMASDIAEMEVDLEQQMQMARIGKKKSKDSNASFQKVDRLQKRIAAVKAKLAAIEPVKKSLDLLKDRYNQNESQLKLLSVNPSKNDLITAGLFIHVLLPSISKAIRHGSKSSNSKFPCVVTRKTVTEVIANKIGIPSPQLSQKKDGANILEIEQRLNAKVLGQPQAVSALVDIYALYRSGARPTNKPIGTLLFAGPTGTGKTKLSKDFAFELFGTTEACIIYNMGQHQHPFSGAQFIEDLAEKLRKNPYSVVLLDEFEKAHKGICDPLLQVLDEGRIGSGTKRVDCSNTMFILTSNLGMSEILRRWNKNPDRPIDDEEMTAILLKEGFDPEFVNRITRIVPFNPLSSSTVRTIIKKEVLNSAYAIAKEKQIELSCDDLVIDFLAAQIEAHGTYQFFGGRPIERLISDKIMIPFAKTFLSQGFNKGDHVEVFVQDGTIAFRKHQVTRVGRA